MTCEYIFRAHKVSEYATLAQYVEPLNAGVAMFGHDLSQDYGQIGEMFFDWFLKLKDHKCHVSCHILNTCVVHREVYGCMLFIWSIS